MQVSQNTSDIRRAGFIVPALLLLGLAIVPFAANYCDEPFYVTFIARMMVYAIAATALNIALGFGGMVSLGHALFLGVGAYSVALPAFHEVDSGMVHLLVTLASCALLGLMTGAISLRTSGIAFIMITLAFAQMGYFVFVSLKNYGGDDGMVITNTSKFFGQDLGQPNVLYAVTLLVLLLSLWWPARLRVSPFGMVVRGAKQNARRTSAIGFSTRSYQLTAYVLSAMLTGVAGMLLANLNAFASPSTLSWVVSGDLIVMVVLGGMGTVAGPLLGAISFLGLEEILKLFTEHWMAIFGPLIVLIAVLGKGGIAGLLAWCEQSRTKDSAKGKER
jgi:branched-chain amino acid transport system permease protein